MEKPHILHMLTPTRNVSPFDVNMAYDAGFDVVVPYGDVSLDQVGPLTQDAIFSRGPSGVKRTGLFIGGREIGLAADMLEAARKAMVPPFEVSVFADPSGAFTTAAALVAKVESHLQKGFGRGLEGARMLVIGGTGPVGAAAGVLAAGAGASVRIASSSSIDRARSVCEFIQSRYGARAEAVSGGSSEALERLVAEADVIVATAKAGVQVLSAAQLAHATALLVAADVNAVPPAGIAGVGVMDDGKGFASGSGHSLGIGALAVGNVKYQVMRSLFKRMLESDRPVYLDFRDAFQTAREHVAR